jgi:hypothetical protein
MRCPKMAVPLNNPFLEFIDGFSIINDPAIGVSPCTETSLLS